MKYLLILLMFCSCQKEIDFKEQPVVSETQEITFTTGGKTYSYQNYLDSTGTGVVGVKNSIVYGIVAFVNTVNVVGLYIETDSLKCQQYASPVCSNGSQFVVSGKKYITRLPGDFITVRVTKYNCGFIWGTFEALVSNEDFERISIEGKFLVKMVY